MKVAVFSDSHGSPDKLANAVKQVSANAPPDVFIFLGDGVSDFEALYDLMHQINPMAQLHMVFGNNDFRCEHLADEMLLELDGVRFLLTHGHKRQVKLSTLPLAMEARRHNCHIALYGHTHKAAIDEKWGVWLMNPGIVGGYASTALVIQINSGIFKPEIIQIQQ